MAASPAAPAPSNWFTEWSARTPVVVRYTIFIALPVSIVALFVPVLADALVLTPAALLWGQVWRFLTMFILQQGIFSILFVVAFLVLSGPAMELRQGSLAFLFQILVLGLFINVAWTAITSILILVWPAAFALFLGEPVSSGLWPIFMALISIQSLADPQGSADMRCFRIPNRAYPWFILGVFCLISFSLRLDLLIGVLIGHASSYGWLKRAELSSAWIAAAETGTGIAVRARMTAAPGYVYAPTTTLSPDLARQREEIASQTGWGAMWTTNRGANANAAASGSGATAPSGSSGSGFHVVRGGLSSSAAAASAAATSTSGLSGTGHTLGASSRPSAPAPPQSREAAAASAAAAAEKRAAAAAAADARARAAAARTMSPSDRQAAAVAAAARGAKAAVLAPSDAEDETANLLTLPSQSQPGPSAPSAESTAAAAALDLTELGFSKAAVEHALAAARGDVDRAIEILTQQPDEEEGGGGGGGGSGNPAVPTI